MDQQPDPKAFVFSDDDEDEVVGGGIPDDDGWIHLEGGKDGRPGDGNPVKRKADDRKRRLVRRAVRRTPKRRS